jgi:threonine/homoserine/homoserine lactone efflux protein
MTVDTTRCANLTPNASPHHGSSRLEYTCLALYLFWLAIILSVIFTERRRRTRKSLRNSIHVWIIRLPFLAGIMPSLFAMISVGLKPQQAEFYKLSQATRDFIEVCSNPLTLEFNSSAAIQTFLMECTAVQNRMDADIGGIGIRISLYISLVVTIVSSLAGHFHQERTAVKDIGTAQLACKIVYSPDRI